ncbi:MAG: translocation/assembly module TamB domain-containing protein [Longimicrobiales bacterium]
MAITRRVVRYLTLTLAGVVVAAVGMVLFLTRTEAGVERAGRYVVERLDRSINGTVTVERITAAGSLLQGVMLHEVAISDVDGRPFLRADSARLGYRIRTFLAGSVVFDRLLVYGPDLVIERLPGQQWNYEGIFADTTAPDTAADSDGDGLIMIRDATVRGGRVTVRFPWEIEPGADTSRLTLEAVPGGRVRTVRFDSVNAYLPEVIWEAPGTDGRLIQVEDLSTRAFIWDTALEVEELAGRVTLQDSVVNFTAEPIRLPDSELVMDGRIVLGENGNRYDLEAVTEGAAFRDFRWLYPRLPAEGGGSLRFRLETQAPGRTLFLARDAELTARGSEVTGSFGVVTGGTLRLTDVDLRATPLDLDFLATLLPDGLPLSGLVMGTATAEGTLDALRTAGDVRHRTFDADGNGAESALRWNGTLGTSAPYPLRAMEVELRAVELAQVAQYVPELRVRGTARGTVRADGSLEDGVQVTGDLSLDHGGQPSMIQGAGRFALGATPTFDLQFEAAPVALELLALQVPALEGLHGEARGPVTVSGSLDDLTVDADIMTPAGDVVVRGNVAVNGMPRYRAEGSITDFRVDRVVPGLPETVVTGRFDLDGEGGTPEEADSRLSLDVLSARVDGVEVYRGTLRGGITSGLARVDSLMVATEVGDAEARGTFGLMEGRTGELDVSVRADSLVFLEPVLLPDAAPLDVDVEQAARIDGRINLDGRLTGSVAEWRTTATVGFRSFVYEQLHVGRGQVDVTWSPDSLLLDLDVDSLLHGNRRLASAQGSVRYEGDRGTVTLTAQGRETQRLMLESGFQPQGDVIRLRLRQLHLTTREGAWMLGDSARVTVGGSGFDTDSLVLVRDPAGARIRIMGVLPWRQPAADEVQEASLSIDLEDVQIGEFLRATQTDTLVGGIVTGKARVTGTALEPELQSRVDIRSFSYGTAVLDSVHAEVAYSDRVLDGSFEGWRDRATILTGGVRVPVELALAEQDERLLDRSMSVTARANGMPAELLTFFIPGLRDLRGQLYGEMAVVGTPVDPDLQGEVELREGSAYFEPLEVGYSRVQANARMAEGSEVELEAELATSSGRGRIRGTLDLVEPRDPVFDLEVVAERLDATRRRDVTAVVDGVARLRGRYTRPVVSGSLTIVRGEMNLDEVWRQYQVVQLDTTLFQMLDTTQVSYRPESESPFLENLRVTNTTLRTDRNFWLRSQELNVEVGGSLALEVDRQSDDFRLTGTLQVVDGNYQLLARGLPSGRRFEIREGTIEFVGTPGINPNLEIEAAYRIRPAQGEPIDVIASVTGTLQDPRVALTSETEVPMSETDLASYILFGRASAELTQAQLDATSGGALAAGLFSPMLSGAASSGIQQVASSLGLPVDYVAFSLPEYGGLRQQAGGPTSLFGNAQIEVGFDPAPNVSVIGSVRLPSGTETEGQVSTLRLFGARVEYRPWQTWTIEGYIEDQFARRPSFGISEISDRKVLGLSFFREWGY